MVNPRFTVLMPTQARPDTLGYAIQSVLDQTEREFELLVVGDGAARGTEALVNRFADSRVRWFDLPKAPNFGYANRNIALRTARGELIAFAADDDLMFPDHLATLGQPFVDPMVQLVYSQALWVSSDGIAAPDLTNLTFPDELRDFLEVGNTVAAGCVVYRSSAFATPTPWPETVREAGDWEMWRRLIREHGVSSVRYIRMPTLLHFSATRKQARDSGFPRLTAYLGVADRVDWWPTTLRQRVPKGVPEQAVYAEAMRADRVVWGARARIAASDVIGRITIDALATTSRALETVRAKLASLSSEPMYPAPITGAPQADDGSKEDVLRGWLEAALTEAARMRAERDQRAAEAVELRRSRSWRLTAPLRALSRLF